MVVFDFSTLHFFGGFFQLGWRRCGGRKPRSAIPAFFTALQFKCAAGRALDDARAVHHALPAVRAVVRVGWDCFMAVDAPDAGLDVRFHHLAFRDAAVA